MKKGYWTNIQTTPEWYSWAGYAFESICYKHIFEISDALKMSPTAIATTWKYSPLKHTNEHGAPAIPGELETPHFS